MNIRTIILMSLVFVLNADEISQPNEQSLILELNSKDVLLVEKALWDIHDNLIISPAILRKCVELLSDPRPQRRHSRDVIGMSPSGLAYNTLERISEFKPSQPSIDLDLKISELKKHLHKKYPNIFQGLTEKNYPNYELLTEKPKEASTVESTISEAMAETPVSQVVAPRETVVDEPPREAKRPLWPYVVVVIVCGGMMLLWRYSG